MIGLLCFALAVLASPFKSKLPSTAARFSERGGLQEYSNKFG